VRTSLAPEPNPITSRFALLPSWMDTIWPSIDRVGPATGDRIVAGSARIPSFRISFTNVAVSARLTACSTSSWSSPSGPPFMTRLSRELMALSSSTSSRDT
jgi:hypothetical protein